MKPKYLPMTLAALMAGQAVADVELVSDRGVIRENDVLSARLKFTAPDQGDLYVATIIGGNLFFFGEDKQFHPSPVPYRHNATFETGQEQVLFQFPGMMIPTGRYPLYAVITDPGADVFDTRLWHGPLAKRLFAVKDPTAHDMDGDGWMDDDSNHDGFSDMDANYDGWRDDDADHNGVPDMEEGGPGHAGGDDHAGHHHGDDGGQGGSNDDTTGGGTTGGGATGGGSVAQGESLYAQKCAGCHGQDPATGGNRIHLGADPARISNAIAVNMGGMGSLANQLTSSDIQAIAAFIHSRTGG